MPLKLLLLLSLSPSLSHAQIGGFFGNLFKKNPPLTFQAKWDCPQDQYNHIPQLPSSGQVEVSVKLKDGEYKIKLKPNIFKVKPSKLSLNYQSCLGDFQKNMLSEIVDSKVKFCQGGMKSDLCDQAPESISGKVSEEIKSEAYFADSDSKLTLERFMPGSQSYPATAEQIKRSIESFCSDGSGDKLALYSQQALKEISKPDFNQDCKARIVKELSDYKTTIAPEICEVSPETCNQIVHSSALAQQSTSLAVIPPTQPQPVVTPVPTPVVPVVTPTPGNQPTPVNEAEEKRWSDILNRKDNYFNEDITKANNDINTSAKGMCDSVKSVVTRYSGNATQEVSELIDRASDKMDSSCKKAILQNMASNFSYSKTNALGSYPQLDIYCNKNPESAVCKSRKERLNNVEALFHKMARTVLGADAENFINECAELDPTKYHEKYKEITTIISCNDLLPGQSKVVSSNDGAPTGVAGNYLLKRRQDGGFDVTVRMDFTGEKDGVKADTMLARVKGCMKDASPYLKGPDGKNLNLVIKSTSDLEKEIVNKTFDRALMPGLNPVDIQSKYGRSHSGAYESDVDCSVITHEVLHLLGLCDEYQEKDVCTLKDDKGENIAVPDETPGAKCFRPPGGSNFNCRVTASIPSIMSNHREVYNKVVPSLLSCGCGPALDPSRPYDGFCQRVMKSGDQQRIKLYLSASFSELTEAKFRGQYCEPVHEDFTRFPIQINSPSIIIKNPTATSIIVKTQELADSWQRTFQNEYKCDCLSTDNKSCLAEIAALKEKVNNLSSQTKLECPSGTSTPDDVRLTKNQNPDEYKELPQGKSYEYGNQTLLFPTKPTTQASLLHPSHYERITGGSCPTKAKNYSLCAKYAYKGSMKSCEELPDVCKDGAQFLGVQQ